MGEPLSVFKGRSRHRILGPLKYFFYKTSFHHDRSVMIILHSIFAPIALFIYF
jgi:hypothetical protein